MQSSKRPARKTTKPPANDPKIVGVSSASPIDEEEVYAAAVTEWRKTEKLIRQKADQRIEFQSGPVCISFIADLHLGSSGVDYERAYREAQIIADTPGMYICLVGDLLDNFILPKLVHARSSSHITIDEEWALVKRYLRIVAAKLLVSVRGNHEKWSRILLGVDYFADIMERINTRAIYDSDDVLVNLMVGGASFPLRLRHHWRCRSIYNATHGIERAFQFEQDFLVGVGAHTHVSGLIRDFNAAGRIGKAILCGSYKCFDAFAREKGFPRANNSTAQSIIFYENGEMLGIEYLELAADTMRRYQKK